MEKEFCIFGKKIIVKDIVNLIKILAKIGLILLIFVSMLLLNHSVLLSPDDYNYTFVQGSGMSLRVNSIENCIKTAKYFYTHWTGRILPHVLIGIFRNINPMAYEITNSLIFILFIIFINKVLNKKSTFLGLISVFGYLAFSKMFGEKFAWISGSFNYLWPSAVLTLFIYLFYNYFEDNLKLNRLQEIAVILFSFIAGFMHENVAFVGGAFLVCMLLFNIKKYFKFEKNKKIVIFLIFLMFCFGALGTIFAPGNFNRMDSTDTNFSWNFLNNYKENKNVLILTIFSIIICFVVQNKGIFFEQKLELLKKENLKKLDFENVKKEILYFILPAIIATVPMAVISYFPPRAFLAYEVMFMIVLSKNVITIFEEFENKYVFVAVFSVIISLIVFGKFSPSTLGQINYIIPYKEKVTAQYERSFMNGEKDVLVSKFEYMNWIHKEDFINIDNFFPEFNSCMPVNALICDYYGFDKLTAIGEDEYLIELKVDTEGINSYILMSKSTKEGILGMEYDNLIRYTIPKDKLGDYVLDCRYNNLNDKILEFRVRSIDKEFTQNVNLDMLIIK